MFSSCSPLIFDRTKQKSVLFRFWTMKPTRWSDEDSFGDGYLPGCLDLLCAPPLPHFRQGQTLVLQVSGWGGEEEKITCEPDPARQLGFGGMSLVHGLGAWHRSWDARMLVVGSQNPFGSLLLRKTKQSSFKQAILERNKISCGVNDLTSSGLHHITFCCQRRTSITLSFPAQIGGSTVAQGSCGPGGARPCETRAEPPS